MNIYILYQTVFELDFFIPMQSKDLKQFKGNASSWHVDNIT